MQRYNPAGALLGQTSVTFTASGFGNQNVLGDVLIQPDGRILVGGLDSPDAGTTYSEYALARLRPDLSLDTGFGSGGKVFTGLGVAFLPGADPETPLGALLRQPDGRIIVVARQSARYWP